jgi:hypothetical protein
MFFNFCSFSKISCFEAGNTELLFTVSIEYKIFKLKKREPQENNQKKESHFVKLFLGWRCGRDLSSRSRASFPREIVLFWSRVQLPQENNKKKSLTL